jgi:lipoate-protein ligase A
MPSLRVFTAEHHDPHFNLATEDWLFQSTAPDEQVLFLWRNQSCIVIGRFQNPWEECNLPAMEADSVLLARRQSGGGAVYHDLGNTNFTFMSPRSSYSKETNFAIIVSALADMGITASTSGRNDIVVNEKKVSGSAFRLTTERAFHHGTLLIDTDLSAIQRYLTPDKTKLASKGIRSVASRVANLTEYNPHLTHESLCNAIMERFFTTYGGRCEPEALTFERLSKEPELGATYRRYADWDWRFGSTPRFSHAITSRFPWGGLTIHLDVHEGQVRSTALHSDGLDVAFLEKLQTCFIGTAYDELSLRGDLEARFATESDEWRRMAQDVGQAITSAFG